MASAQAYDAYDSESSGLPAPKQQTHSSMLCQDWRDYIILRALSGAEDSPKEYAPTKARLRISVVLIDILRPAVCVVPQLVYVIRVTRGS